MGLTTLPTQTEESLGKVKKATPLARQLLPDYDVTPDQHNALVAAVIDLANEVGLSDGSTSGSLVKRMRGVEVRVASVSSSRAITSADRILAVSTASAAVVLTLPNPASEGVADFMVKKTNTGANSITLRPHVTSGSGPSIEGGAAGADFMLVGSDSASRGQWYFFTDGTNWWVG